MSLTEKLKEIGGAATGRFKEGYNKRVTNIKERYGERVSEKKAAKEREETIQAQVKQKQMKDRGKREKRAIKDEVERRIAEDKFVSEHGLKRTRTPGRYRVGKDKEIDIDFSNQGSVRSARKNLHKHMDTKSEIRTRASLFDRTLGSPGAQRVFDYGAGVGQNFNEFSGMGGGFGGIGDYDFIGGGSRRGSRDYNIVGGDFAGFSGFDGFAGFSGFDDFAGFGGYDPFGGGTSAPRKRKKSGRKK